MYNESRSHSHFAVCKLDIAVSALDIALGNHALHVQPTDYSLICRYRLVNNLQVALFPRINCRLSANEKTDGDYNV